MVEGGGGGETGVRTGVLATALERLLARRVINILPSMERDWRGRTGPDP